MGLSLRRVNKIPDFPRSPPPPQWFAPLPLNPAGPERTITRRPQGEGEALREESIIKDLPTTSAVTRVRRKHGTLGEGHYGRSVMEARLPEATPPPPYYPSLPPV